MDTKSQTKEESTTANAPPAASNGDVSTAKAEQELGDFVVLDESKASGGKNVNAEATKKEPVVETENKNDENVDKDKKPAAASAETEKKNADKEPVNDIEKNGDSLILTADEDLEQDASSPKKPKPEAVPSEVEESKQEESDTKLPNSSNEEVPAASKAPSEKPSNKNQRVIWVSNISKTIKATDLKQHLSKAGKVTTAKIVTDGKRCFGYVQMENANDAAECVKTLNNTNFDGKNILLSFEKPIKTNAPSKPSETRSSAREGSRRSNDTKRVDKRRRSSSKHSTDRNNTDGKTKAEGSVKSVGKRSRNHSRSRSRDRHLRERNERDRLKRRIMEEERKNHEAKLRQIELEERQREKEFRLDQERRKLQMERELFEKQKREWARINEERRKLERARLEVEQQRVKLEEDLKKERMKRKSPEMMHSVVSKISDPSKKGLKMMKRDDYKSPYNTSAPSPPKLGMDFDLSTRKMDDRKMGRIGARKIEVIDRKFYGESSDRKKHFGRKPEYDDKQPYMKRYTGEREDEHRTQWSPPTGGYGPGVGSSTPRYQDSMPSQQFGGGQSSRGSGYYYHPSASTQEFPRYDQVSNRKY